jgi:hypothetical protein
MRVCGARVSQFYRAKFIPQLSPADGQPFCRSGNDAGPVLTRMESNMINKLLGAAAMAAVAFAIVPASAAKMGGCSADNLSKTESMIEAMADGQGKIVAQKEIALAQDAMLGVKMGACAAHLNKAMQAGASK